MEADITVFGTPKTWSVEVERSLLEAARGMNKEAIMSIFDRYSRPLYNYALSLGNDPVTADQIVGDAFAKFLDQLAARKGPDSNLRSYLFQITYHLMIDQIRASHHEAPLEDATFLQSAEQTLHAGLENRMLLRSLLRAICNDLTKDQRHVMVLRFFEGFSISETADIIGKTVDNIKIIQNRGIAKLRKVLAEFF
jgi:RNA polymerase sigma-70 factor (ECF subfamily)